MNPTPYFTEDFWRSVELVNLLGANSFEEAPCISTSWVACCGYHSEPFSPNSGYPVAFPTVSDCLLWFRWMVLGFAVDDNNSSRADTVVLHGIYKEIADDIDQAIADGFLSAEEILLDAADKLDPVLEDASFWISCIQPIHTYMQERGSIEQWQAVLEDPSARLVGDRFELSATTWDRVWSVIMSELVDCDGVLPELDA